MSAALLSIASLQIQIAERDQRISYLEEQLAWFKRQLFGTRSERVADVSQEQGLFEGFFHFQPNHPQAQMVHSHARKKPDRKGQDKIQLPADLSVETIVLDIPEKDKICLYTALRKSSGERESSFIGNCFLNG